MTQIAFIGLGNMGLPMARNLIKAGHSLTAYDLVPKAMQEASLAGARTVASARETLQGAQVVISMLPASPHVEALYLGDTLVLLEGGRVVAHLSAKDFLSSSIAEVRRYVEAVHRGEEQNPA